MAEKLLMLALSPTMEQGIIAKWNKNEGDRVASGDVLCEVETDKAVMDYESSADGVLLKIVIPEGSNASIGETIAIVGKEGEDISGLLSEGDQTAAPKSDQTNKSEGDQTGAAEKPKTMTEADDLTQTSEKPSASAEESGVSDPAATPDAGGGSDYIKSSPLARKLADMNGLALESVQGSGPAGRIVKSDIENAMATKQAQPPAGKQEPTVTGKTGRPAARQSASVGDTGRDIVIPVSGKRRIIAQRLSESMYSAPHYYLKVPVIMDTLLAARSQLNAKPETKVGFNAFLIKLAAEALKRHPMVNASWTGDTIVQHGQIDIGLAVAQDDGLITPVVRDCGNKGIIQIDQEFRDLIQKARSNSLKPDEYTGATFTISNLGSYGIEEFTAIINPPGSAILAVGEIRKEAVVQADDSIQVQSVMKLTLSCDHRVIDGSVGASFLTDFRQMLEEPVRALY